MVTSILYNDILVGINFSKHLR